MINIKMKRKLISCFIMLLVMLLLVVTRKYDIYFLDIQITACLMILSVIFYVLYSSMESSLGDVFEKPKKVLFTVLDYFQTIVFSLLTIHLIYLFVMFPTVKGPSMDPTLHQNDRLIVLSDTKHLERFDVVVFVIDTKILKDAPPDQQNELWVKRVIGLPGDRIRYIDGELFVNGEQVREDYLYDEQGNKHHNIETYLPIELDNQIIPEGYYLVLGDNRGNSMDSRSIGYIPKELIIGEGKYIIESIFKWKKIGSE